MVMETEEPLAGVVKDKEEASKARVKTQGNGDVPLKLGLQKA